MHGKESYEQKPVTVHGRNLPECLFANFFNSMKILSHVNSIRVVHPVYVINAVLSSLGDFYPVKSKARVPMCINYTGCLLSSICRSIFVLQIHVRPLTAFTKCEQDFKSSWCLTMGCYGICQ